MFALPSMESADQLEKQNCVSYIGKKDIEKRKKKKTYCAPAALFKPLYFGWLVPALPLSFPLFPEFVWLVPALSLPFLLFLGSIFGLL